jgi:hypothetical protein
VRRRRIAGVWRWEDGSGSTYTNWGVGDPLAYATNAEIGWDRSTGYPWGSGTTAGTTSTLAQLFDICERAL